MRCLICGALIVGVAAHGMALTHECERPKDCGPSAPQEHIEVGSTSAQPLPTLSHDLGGVMASTAATRAYDPGAWPFKPFDRVWGSSHGRLIYWTGINSDSSNASTATIIRTTTPPLT